MRIGLLLCDHVDDRYRDVTAGDYDDMFIALLSHGTDDDIEFVSYDVIGGTLPESVRECDGWLITGSRFSAYDDEPWIQELCGFVRDLHAAAAPTVGICFGHQVIAHALGGRVEKAARGWGVGAIQVDGALAGRLLFMHQDQVTKLPDAAQLVGSADHCPIAAFSCGSILAMQGHPEFTVAYERALLEARELRIGADVTAAGLASLDQPTDEARVARVMLKALGATPR
jgi:GMP synthase-like glutamine amidotransferase